MRTTDPSPALARLFSELIDGVSSTSGGGFVLNTGDVGLLRSIKKLSAADASESSNGGATIAAHVQHVRYELSLMNRWASQGGNPFADAKWNEAWKTSTVDLRAWAEICQGFEEEAHRWLDVLRTLREDTEVELTGLVGSVAHLAYHLGAIRQIA